MRVVLLVWLVLALAGVCRAEALWEKQFADWCKSCQVEEAALLMVDMRGPTRYAFFGNATVTTPFLMGSLTKSFTAQLIEQQVERGIIRLDDPVLHYLPYWKMADVDQGRQVTVRHLLTHSSGLPKSAGRRFEGGLEAGVRALAEVSLVAAPGTLYEYSNANYLVLGCILEAVTHRSYSDLLKASLLEPLGMNRSSLRQFWGRRFKTACFEPSGGLASVPEDMSLYLKSQLKDGKRLRELIPGIGYGFGWHCDASGRWANHSGEVWRGGSQSYRSFAALRPQAGKGLAIMARMPHAPAPTWHDLAEQLWKSF